MVVDALYAVCTRAKSSAGSGTRSAGFLHVSGRFHAGHTAVHHSETPFLFEGWPFDYYPVRIGIQWGGKTRVRGLRLMDGEGGFCDCCCSQESSVYFFAGRDVLFGIIDG